MSIQDIIEAATPGPWERGDRWWIQGASQCLCRDSYGPLVYEGRMKLNGRMMEAHVHRTDEPSISNGITTSWLDERTHKPHNVVIETDEYGLMDDADARFIATFDPEHVALMEAVCEAAEDDYMAEPHDDHERNRLATLNAVAALQAYRKERGL